jgi:hypothetical protein
MPVTIESRIRRMQVFNLEHGAFCAGGECACSDITAVVVEHNSRTGERAPRHLTKKAPASLTLLALERREGLRESILAVPELRAAIDRGHVRVVEQTPATQPRRPVRAGKEE